MLPGALLLGLSFNSGGFFPDATAIAALVLTGLLVARVIVAEKPFAGIGAPLGLAAGALCLYAAWSLASSAWSDAPGRALIEFDRALLYLLGLVFFGSFARSDERMRWIVRGLVLGIAAVCVAALVSRTVPELWSAAPSPVAPERLSFPLTYWNALGAMAGVGVILGFHLTSDARETLVVRALGTAALPVLVPTMVLTLSRGALASCVAGLVVYVLLGRPHALPAGALAAATAVTPAAIVSYRANELQSGAMTAEAVAQGHELAAVVAACAAGGAIVRTLAARLDRRGPLLPSGRSGQLAAGAVAGVLVVAAGVWLATGGTGYIERQYDRFLVQGGLSPTASRLTEVGGNGRPVLWDVALIGWRQARLEGQGAGTFGNVWNRHRPSKTETTEAHSLYVETLGELGLVGAALLAIFLGSVLVGTAMRIRRGPRPVYAALFGAMVTWALQAGVDWLWEMPAVTLWVFCAGGAALASAGPRGPRGLRRHSRAPIVAGAVLLAAIPAAVGLSQIHLTDATQAFEREDCPDAVDAAEASISVLDARPEPYEVLGYCGARAGRDRRAIAAFQDAIRLDGENWELHYGLALARAYAGEDPRPALARAARLNPLASEPVEAAIAFDADSARAWRRAARALPLAFP